MSSKTMLAIQQFRMEPIDGRRHNPKAKPILRKPKKRVYAPPEFVKCKICRAKVSPQKLAQHIREAHLGMFAPKKFEPCTDYMQKGL